ncbi:MAG: diacylglycerol/lipid kinase family protein [Anaerolineae bacterium]
MANYKIIVNPTSGRGTGGQSIPAIREYLSAAGCTYDLVTTERPGHAIELARQAAVDGYTYVVAAGGDGTCNEVINGLMQAKNNNASTAIMGVLCVGRGNDFAYGAGVPTTLPEGLKVLVEAERRWIDIGLVKGGMYPQGRYFGNGIGIGFDAVVGFVAFKKKLLKGFISYIVSALETIFIYYKAPTVEIRYGDQFITQSSLMVSVMNGRRMGGGFMMTPDSLPDDGLFDMCIVKQVSKLRALGIIPLFLKGTQATDKATRMAQADKISVKAIKGSLPAHADGETLCYDALELNAEILPRQIEILYQAKDS